MGWEYETFILLALLFLPGYGKSYFGMYYFALLKHYFQFQVQFLAMQSIMDKEQVQRMSTKIKGLEIKS